MPQERKGCPGKARERFKQGMAALALTVGRRAVWTITALSMSLLCLVSFATLSCDDVPVFMPTYYADQFLACCGFKEAKLK